MKPFYVCTVQYGSHYPDAVIEQLKMTNATLLASTVATILECTVLDVVIISETKCYYFGLCHVMTFGFS